MVREDYSNRSRESIHRNFLFDDVDVILSPTIKSGQGSDNIYYGQSSPMEDTFIYNQSWWTKNSDCHNHFYKLFEGMTAGHTHALPKDRSELVLGLMNRFRESIGGRHTKSMGPAGESSIPRGSNPDDSPYTDWEDCYMHYHEASDSINLNPWYKEDIGSGTPFEDACFRNLWLSTPESMHWKVDGRAWDTNPDAGDAPDYNQTTIWDPCQNWEGYEWAPPYGGGGWVPGRFDAGNNEDKGGMIWFSGQCHDEWPTANVHCGSTSGVGPCLGDGADYHTYAYSKTNDPRTLFHEQWEFPGANWMRNQPPSIERTPFRPIILCNLRADDNPAVPEGAFIKSCKLILTASQQSIAWPLGGYTAEIYNLATDDNDEDSDIPITIDANWWSPDPPSNEKDYSHNQGDTLGQWYHRKRRLEHETRGATWGSEKRWLPDPMHPSIFPKQTKRYDWGTTAGSYEGPDGNLWAGNGLKVSPKPNQVWAINVDAPWEADRPHQRACDQINWNVIGDYPEHYGKHEWGGYFSEQLMVGVAYDGENSWHMPPFVHCPDRRLWKPIEWYADCGMACMQTDRGCSAGHWQHRASEVEGLTGCGGCVSLWAAGLTHGVCLPSDGNNCNDNPYYSYSGYKMNNLDDNQFDEINYDFPPEWTPIPSPNYSTFHIPKFTNAGWSGSWDNLTNPQDSFGYATGSTGPQDGRGVTFAIELDKMARYAINNKEQQLDLIIKGEYKNVADGSTLEPVYESGGALWVRTRHAGADELPDNLYPYGEENVEGALPAESGFIGKKKLWSTDAAQIATNFFSTNAPCPCKPMGKLNFYGKGSTMEWHSGDLQVDFKLSSPGDPTDTITMQDDDSEYFYNFVKVFSRLNQTDTFAITDSSEMPIGDDNYTDTNGTFKVVSVDRSEDHMTIEVTGDTGLYPLLTGANRPTVPFSVEARFIGTHLISIEGDYYIENRVSNAAFKAFGSMNSCWGEEATHGTFALPELYGGNWDGFNSARSGYGGITGGGVDLIRISPHSTTQLNQNDKTYTILDIYWNDEGDYSGALDPGGTGIPYEIIKVKEKVIHEVRNSASVCHRVNHLPRLEISYRTKHQYDRPADA